MLFSLDMRGGKNDPCASASFGYQSLGNVLRMFESLGGICPASGSLHVGSALQRHVTCRLPSRFQWSCRCARVVREPAVPGLGMQDQGLISFRSAALSR